VVPNARLSWHARGTGEEAIKRFVEEHNRSLMPLVWTTTPDVVVQRPGARIALWRR
jgi:hypothetical protein